MEGLCLKVNEVNGGRVGGVYPPYTGTARTLRSKAYRCRDHLLQLNLLETSGLDMPFDEHEWLLDHRIYF